MLHATSSKYLLNDTNEDDVYHSILKIKFDT